MKRALVLLALCAPPVVAQAHGKQCAIEIEGTDSTTLRVLQSLNGLKTSYWGAGVKGRCAGTTMLITADSAESSDASGLMTLLGRVRYTEKGTAIDADRMLYYERDAHLLATGHVRATTSSKSSLRADQVIYFRAAPGIRDVVKATASGGRPHAELRDSVGAKDTSITLVDADRLDMAHDSLFYAAGNVIITRTDVVATSDSAFIDTGRRFSQLLRGTPRIVGRGSRKFSLEGNVLDIFGRDREIDSLYAKGAAVAVSDSLKLDSDTLHLRISGGRITHVLAWGPKRAHAVSPERNIVANRLIISMPGGQVEELYAYGKAHIETKPDSLVRSKDRDWIEGDTVIATFEKPAPGDTASQPPLRSLVARINAKSFYQVPPKQRTDTVPSIDYVGGPRIDVGFVKGAVTNVHVTGGDAHGIHIEPVKDSVKATPGKKPPAKKPPPPQTPPRKPPPPQ